MPTEELTEELKNQYHYSKKIFSSYSSHINSVEDVFKGDISPLNFKNLRLTGFLEHPSKLSQALLLNLLSNRLIIPIRDKKTLDNE
jgi:hypothetical protein